jgi:hypothetical protein
MGFALGASFFFGLYGRNVMGSSMAAHHEQQATNETTQSQKKDADEAIAFYTLWLMVFHRHFGLRHRWSGRSHDPALRHR